mgnify:CR=1 FL=1
MKEYNIRFVVSAAKEFRALPAEIKARIGEAVDSLSQNPRPSGVRKLREHEGLYRIRVGHYRVIYEIDDQTRSILVTRVRHRREAYR